MTFPILGGNGAVAGYSIDNSLRYNNNDSPELSRTPSSASNKKTFTFSTWLKRSELSSHSGGASSLLVAGVSTNILNFRFQDSGILNCILSKSGSTANGFAVDTDAVFRDVSAWYHIVLVVDTTQASITDAVKIYVNNTLQSFSSSSYGGGQNVETPINDTLIHSIGYNTVDNNQAFDGYLAETYLIDGQALSPTDFAEADEDSGIWKPKQFSGSYGTNGYYLDFENSGSLGADQSGNGNNFTPTNLASTDQTTDTPTNNFATLSSIDTHTTSPTLAEGNLDFTAPSGTAFTPARSTMAVSSGKWYMEYKFKTAGGGVGVMTTQSPINDHLRDDSDVRSLYRGWNGYYYGRNNSGAIDDVGDNSQTFSADDIGMIALDLDNGYVYFGKNGTWLYGQDGSTTGVPTSGSSGTGSANHSTQLLTNQHDGVWGFMAYDISTATTGRVIANFGNPPYAISSGNSDDNGYGNFEYAPPSGYLALCTQNLATALSPTIDDGSQYFNTVLYSGNSSSNSVTGVGFQPDFLWIKSRNAAENHVLFNSNVGAGSQLRSNTNGTETSSAYIDSFDTDGFSMNTALKDTNFSSYNYVSWSWLASGGTTSSNTDGSITSTVQANTTAGFSIVTYTGTGTAGTIGHGLGKKPQCILLKNRSFNDSWITFHEPEGATKFMSLDTTGASDDFGAMWNDTEPTTSVFGIGSDSGGRWVNSSGDTYVAYCFAEIEGYSKFGSYVGNNSSTDGTFVYLGFRPSFVLAKNISRLETWWIRDSARDTYNATTKTLKPQDSASEQTAGAIDLLSNGFKLRNNDWSYNYVDTYIYMAFAENPFVSSSGVPVVAR